MSTNNNIENNEKLKGNPFKVPNGYFENLQVKLTEIPKTDQAKVVELKPGGNNNHYKIYLAAATVSILIATVWMFWPTTPTTIEESIATEDLIALNEQGYLPIDAYTVIDLLEEDEIDNMTFETGITDYYELTQPTIIEEYYLLNEEL